MEIKELNDETLEKIQGGKIDWQLFSMKFLEAIGNKQFEITDYHKKLVDTIKEKNWIEVAAIVLGSLEEYPEIAAILTECI